MKSATLALCLLTFGLNAVAQQSADAEIRHVTIWSDGPRMAGDLHVPHDLKENG